MCARAILVASVAMYACIECNAHGETHYEFGFGKADITPTTPLRLSGYGNRRDVSEAVDEKLYARAMAVRDTAGQLNILVSVDTIGFSGVLTKSIAKRIADMHNIPRSRLVICCTHSHTAPHLSYGLSNLFAVPLTDEQTKNTREYTDRIADQVVASVTSAIEDLKPGRLFVGMGKATFAHNRRVLQGDLWTGFGEQPTGPTDHSLPFLKITDADGRVRGVVFNYTCHCTTFGGGYNRVNGDWAGYAAKFLEEEIPGATALCTIGCGADQNPRRDSDPQVALNLAKSHGREIAQEIQRLLSDELRQVISNVAASFGYAGLPVDRPTTDELTKALTDRQPQVARHARNMLDVYKRMGRLPETYPAPVQVWRFGDELCMVFLGGEVVVDYALRLNREIESGLVWVSAYCNDVFGYVASERVRKEGGYEVTGSMIYYNQPGPWAEGTEEVLVRRIHELFKQGSFAGPLSPQQALGTFQLPSSFKIGIVAAEALIADPVNFAVGADGKLWVVEMGDYPRGSDDQGSAGGRVKLLVDVDGNGTYDRSTVFLDGLSYPNGVIPHRDGILISGAPAILFAKDIDGDGRADKTEELYVGFTEANPQHRVSGFSYGLDNWFYLAAGAHNGKITSTRTSEVVNISGQDFRIHPDKGLIEPVGGHTQFGRNRDDWGNWFGGDNSHPIWHYVIDDRYFARNPFVAAPDSRVHLIAPPFAPPVFPASRTLDRFNDLFALDRFTSACSPVIFRDASLGAEMHGAALVSEPVHNLVHRAMLSDDGATFRANRHSSDASSEFLASTDHWFRPTTISTGPDGALWVADMYRQVIEHPQWIPEAWQDQLDLRAGHQRGRIYRIYKDGQPISAAPNLAEVSSAELVDQLNHSNGWRRDTAQRLLVERNDQSVVQRLVDLLDSASKPAAKVHALGVLQGLESLTAEHLLTALDDADDQVVLRAVLVSETQLNRDPSLGRKLLQLVDHPNRKLRLQLALTLGQWDDPAVATALIRLVSNDMDDPWMRAAVLSSSLPHATAMLVEFLQQENNLTGRSRFIQDLISTALGLGDDKQIGTVLSSITALDEQPQAWHFEALASFDRALRRKKMSLARLHEVNAGNLQEPLRRASEIIRRARSLAADDQTPIEQRLATVPLLGRDTVSKTVDLQILTDLLSASQPLPIQLAAVRAMSSFDDEVIAPRMLANWSSLSPRVQSELLVALLSRPPWRERLVSALEAGEVRVNDLNAATRTQLTSSGDSDLQSRARKLFATSASDDRRRILDEFRADAVQTGDPIRGAKKFATTCAACHRHQDIGNDFGPQLAALSDKSNEALLIAIFDPNRAIENKYKNYTCVTADGRTFSGMIVSESASSITLALPNGTRQELLRVDIDELFSTGVSFMPEGLERELDAQSLADVFAFIRQSP